MMSVLSRFQILFVTFVLGSTLTSCVTMPAPIEEYVLADTAIKAASNIQAVRYSPGYWHEAEEAFRQARILYHEREYEEAQELFIKARIAAEKSENSTRLLRQRNGEVL